MSKAKDHSTQFFLIATVLTFVLPFAGSHWVIILALVIALFLIGCIMLPRNPHTQEES